MVIEKGEDIRVHGNLMDPDGNLIFSGSVESQLLQDFFMETMKNKIRIDSVKKILSRKEDSDEFLRYSAQADSAFYKISGNQKQLEKDFIDKNPLSLASLIVLNYAFGPKPVLTMEEDFPYYQKLTYLIGKYPKNKHVLFHRTRVNLFLNNLKMQ